ncbi:dienelactone hydrolase family protein [Tsukamurella soli]|uniref:Dienelactone hydrolase domain-containing protein n=1 Tax=Tsukamurella soli TaxID=644556 RepID=A0ABP8JT97_9ACTN
MGTTFTVAGLPVYRADPASGPIRGAVIVIHEIWGLVGQIESVADRLAAEGYVGIAPDLFSSFGLTPEVGAQIEQLMFHGTEEDRARAQPLLREKAAPARSPEFAARAVPALVELVDALVAEGTAPVFVTGFCFGGTYAFALAAADRRIAGAAPFYGIAPEHADLSAIACPVLAFYGGTDARVTGTLPQLTEAMAEAGVEFSPVVYPEAGHAFFNDTNPVMYQPDAAADAWTRLLEFLATRSRD